MTASLHELALRINDELIDLDRAVHKASNSWSVVRRGADDGDAYLDSVALNLHSFYSGLERLFELIARTVDDAVPAGESWHRELLAQMSRDMSEVRPAVINAQNAHQLDEFRRFRHLVRNVYAADLIPTRMEGMLLALPDLWSGLRAELLAFATFLEQAA